jgi:hypothetical protein
LESLGYTQTFAIWKHGVFEPRKLAGTAVGSAQVAFGENEHTAIKIELHTHISERLPLTGPDVSEFIFPREFKPGLNPYPSNLALMQHLLLHAAGNIMPRGLRLIHLHDIALLASRLSDDEWQRLTQLRVAGRPMWWAVPPLRLVQRYYRHCVPEDIVKQLSLACPRSLRRLSLNQRLSDVSHTALAEMSFPGFAWARTVSQKLDYVLDCFHPGTKRRSMIQMMLAEPWAVSSGWSRLGRAQRVMRRVLTRPPRLPAMYVVHAAIAASEHP